MRVRFEPTELGDNLTEIRRLHGCSILQFLRQISAIVEDQVEGHDFEGVRTGLAARRRVLAEPQRVPEDLILPDGQQFRH